MIQLVYISTATAPISFAEVEAICEQGRRNNHRDEITGLLIAMDGRFLQVLEGPKEAVEEAFLRIIVDRRHRDLTLLSRQVIARRYFGTWNMRHCRSVSGCGDVVAKMTPLIDFAPEHVKEVFADVVSRLKINAQGKSAAENRQIADYNQHPG